MTAFIIVIGGLFVLGYFINKKKQKAHSESYNAFVGDLDTGVDSKLDEALKKAEEIGRANGID